MDADRAGRWDAEHADDVAAVLDHLGIDRVFLTGMSGGSVHALAFCSRYPDRVRAATVISGFAPMLEEELEQIIELNSTAYASATTATGPASRPCSKNRSGRWSRIRWPESLL